MEKKPKWLSITAPKTSNCVATVLINQIIAVTYNPDCIVLKGGFTIDLPPDCGDTICKIGTFLEKKDGCVDSIMDLD